MSKISIGSAHGNVIVGGDVSGGQLSVHVQETVFTRLRVALDPLEQTERKKLLEALEELRTAKRGPEAESKFAKFIGLAANCMTLVQPFLPELVRLL